MPRFNLDDYVQVNERIQQFWIDHPNGAIVTECLYVDDTIVQFKAAAYFESVQVPHAPNGIGHAEEHRVTEEEAKSDYKKKNDPNYTSAVENCETSAVGRALAMCGYHISKSVASRQEMEKVKRLTDKPKVEAETSGKTLDKAEDSAKVGTTEATAEPKLDAEEARLLAGRIKSIVPDNEMGAVKLKLVGMGIEQQKTLSETLQTMTKNQATELYSWIATSTKSNGDAGQTTTA